MVNVEVRTEAGEPVVVRRATGSAGAAQLRAVGERLRRAAHPGVVRVVSSEGDDEAWELQLAHAGRPLDAVGSLDVTTIARLLAGVASILAELHDLGLVHGHLEASHVLVGPHGHPVLCGFGPDAAGREPADDVAAVGALLVELLGPDDELEPIPERRWARPRAWVGWHRRSLLLVADQACAEPPTRRPTARRLAAAISAAVPAPEPRRPPERAGVRSLTSPQDRDEQPADAPRAARRGSVLLVVSAVLALIIGARSLRAESEPTMPSSAQAAQADPPPVERPSEVTRPTTTTTTRPAFESAGAAHVDGNVVAMGELRFEVGAPGDRVTVGDWDCDGLMTPAVLRPATGAVFAFAEWATDGPLTARALRDVADGIDVRAVPVGQGCHRLEVVRRDGQAVPVEVVTS